MLPVDAVLGDLYLETHQYELAAKYYFNYILTNKLVIHQAYLSPSGYRQILFETLPKDLEIYRNTTDESVFSWGSIFSTSNPKDVVSYIPLASNKFRGTVTELPRYFGYDLYNTNVSTASDRYLVERQIDASQAYLNLNKQQLWYYMPASATDVVKSLDLGDLRRYETMEQITKEDSTFAVMSKFFGANVPIYRTATIYLRLAEALNRMEQPEAAFAILRMVSRMTLQPRITISIPATTMVVWERSSSSPPRCPSCPPRTVLSSITTGVSTAVVLTTPRVLSHLIRWTLWSL